MSENVVLTSTWTADRKWIRAHVNGWDVTVAEVSDADIRQHIIHLHNRSLEAVDGEFAPLESVDERRLAIAWRLYEVIDYAHAAIDGLLNPECDSVTPSVLEALGRLRSIMSELTGSSAEAN